MKIAAEELRKIAADWRTARRIFPIYMAIAERTGLPLQPCAELESPVDRAEPEALARVEAWMNDAESFIAPHHLRTYCQTSIVGEPALRALVLRLVAKRTRHEADRDKLDFLLVQYFAQCAPMKAQRDDVRVADVAAVLEVLLGEVAAEAPAWLEPLEAATQRLIACGSLRDLLDQKLLADGRKMKIASADRYFQPNALVAFTRYNYIARRVFFRLMLAELDGLRTAIARLEKAGVTAVDCTCAGMSAQQPLASLKEIANGWKQPFRAEYTEGLSFEQLTLVHRAVSAAAENAPALAMAAAAETSVSAGAVFVNPGAATEVDTLTPSATNDVAKPFDVSAEFENVRQLLSHALSNENGSESTMTRLTLGAQRLVLSSWEVRAFVDPAHDFAEAMQKGVVARVLLERELDVAKKRKLAHLPELLGFAKAHAAGMQEQVAQARDARDIDAAVTLAATAKRLAQLVQEAHEKFSVTELTQ